MQRAPCSDHAFDLRVLYVITLAWPPTEHRSGAMIRPKSARSVSMMTRRLSAADGSGHQEPSSYLEMPE